MKHTLLIFFLIIFSCSQAQDLYFPPLAGDTWETVDPSELNWCSDSLDALQDFLMEKNSKAFIVLKDGKIAVEWYFDEFTQDSVWYWASAGKTMTSFLVGLAQEDGYLDISSPSSEYLAGAGWTSAGLTEESQITVWNQLTMTSGLDDGYGNNDCWEPSCLQYLANAGTRWAYHNAPYTLLDSVIETATGMPTNQYLFTRLSLSTGIYGAYIPIGYKRVFFSQPRSMARFGLLSLAQGNWNGNPIMSDQSYFNQMVNTSQNLNKSYGYLWWLNGKGEHMLPGIQLVIPEDLVPTAPADMYAGMGLNEQRVYVVPSQNMVVVRMGDAASDNVFLALSEFDDALWEKMGNLECEPMSLSELETAAFSIYPNPSNDFITIDTELEFQQIELIDLIGKSLGVYKSKHLDISLLENGTYVLQITLNDGTQISRKIVKQ